MDNNEVQIDYANLLQKQEKISLYFLGRATEVPTLYEQGSLYILYSRALL